MKIFYSADRIMSDGEIVIVGRIYKDDVKPDDPGQCLAAHGETARCESDDPKHAHSKACAVALLPSVKEAMEAYFEAWDAAPEDAVHVEMPKKEVIVKVDGKSKKQMVDDRDL